MRTRQGTIRKKEGFRNDRCEEAKKKKNGHQNQRRCGSNARKKFDQKRSKACKPQRKECLMSQRSLWKEDQGTKGDKDEEEEEEETARSNKPMRMKD